MTTQQVGERREAIARIIDPSAMVVGAPKLFRDRALTKADAILALPPFPNDEDAARECLAAHEEALGFELYAEWLRTGKEPAGWMGAFPPEEPVNQLALVRRALAFAAFRGSGVSPNPGPTQNPKKD
jgi:hypothetical protein